MIVSCGDPMETSETSVDSLQNQAPVFPEKIIISKGHEISEIVPVLPGKNLIKCSIEPELPKGLLLSDGCILSGNSESISLTKGYVVRAVQQNINNVIESESFATNS